MEHILVVDDEPMITSVFKQYLDTHGYFTSVANDGATALQILEKVQIDALITDYRMHGMNGAELVIKAREANPFLPVIFVSAYGKEIEINTDGRTLILSKPLELSDLKVHLEQLMQVSLLISDMQATD